MQIHYELNKKDYIDFNMNHFSISPTLKRTIFLQRYIFSIIYLIIPFVLTTVSDIPFGYWASIFGITYILWVVFYPRYFMKTVQRNIEKLMNEGHTKSMLGEHSLTLTDEGVIEKNNSGETKTNWSSIEKIVQTDEHLYIYIDSIKAYIVPIKAFKGESEKQYFLNEIRKYRPNLM